MKRIQLLIAVSVMSFFGLYCSEQEQQKRTVLMARITVMLPLDIRHTMYPDTVWPSPLYTYCRAHYDDPDCQKAADIIEHIFKTGKFHYLKETRPLTEIVEVLAEKDPDIDMFSTTIDIGVALDEIAKKAEAKP